MSRMYVWSLTFLRENSITGLIIILSFWLVETTDLAKLSTLTQNCNQRFANIFEICIVRIIILENTDPIKCRGGQKKFLD